MNMLNIIDKERQENIQGKSGKKKSEKKVNGDIVQELKELKQLYDDGILTKEEFVCFLVLLTKWGIR